MRAVLTQIRAAVIRRRAQTATVLLVTLLGSSVATMALTLLVRSTQPWDEAFTRVAGPHLLFHVDASRVTAGQLQATASLPGVVAAGPPHPTALVPFQRAGQKGTLELIGRDDPGGALDRMTIVAGRWPAHPGEIAVLRTNDTSIPITPKVGETIQALTGRGAASFKVVGEAVDVGGHSTILDFSTGNPAAWVLPGEIAPLVEGTQIRLGYEMAYRFAHAATRAELDADKQEVKAALPADSEMLPVSDWLRVRMGSIWFISLLSSIIFSFTVFALIAVAVIVGSVVAGSVLSSFREIGIIKALGFTPAEVLVVYVGQMVVPTAIGAVLGIPLGAAGSRPFLDDAANSLRLPEPAIFDPFVDLLVPVALIALVILAAVAPALRAAATDSVRAMTLGSAPPATRRSRLAAALSRLGLPRPLTLGAADAFARPMRAAMTLVALGIGVATVTFAIGFQSTLIGVLVDQPSAYGYGQDAVIHRYPAISDQEVTSQLAGQPETKVVVATRMVTIRVPGQAEPDPVYAMRGDARVLGFSAVEGRWFQAPGEAVIGVAVAREAHLRIGDTFTGTLAGDTPLQLRVVGLINDFNTSGRGIRIGWETFATAMPGTDPDDYLVSLKPGRDPKAYVHRIAALSPDFIDAKATTFADLNLYTNLISGMVGGLALVLVLIAAAGVFNATLLTTRERVRDIAVLKAVGMTSRQIALMAIGSTAVLAVVAVLLGVPAGVWLQGLIWENMASGFGVLVNPTSGLAPVSLALALVAAFAVALSGAALPARWAAATPVAQVLRSE